MSDTAKEKILAANTEIQAISRYMTVWANTWENKPENIDIIRYEDLNIEATQNSAMSLSTIQGSFITRRYITGGHEAEYQFKMIYRIKSVNSNDKRLSADEYLNNFGDWARSNLPDLGEGVRAIKVEPTTQSSLFARYEDGYEDYQILMKLTYEIVYPLSFTDTE